MARSYWRFDQDLNSCIIAEKLMLSVGFAFNLLVLCGIAPYTCKQQDFPTGPVLRRGLLTNLTKKSHQISDLWCNPAISALVN